MTSPAPRFQFRLRDLLGIMVATAVLLSIWKGFPEPAFVFMAIAMALILGMVVNRLLAKEEHRRRRDEGGPHSGFLACQDCREIISLGKWLHDENGEGIGFSHDKLGQEEKANSPRLGDKALKFLARHLDHQLLAGSDGGGLIDKRLRSEYRDVDEEY
ncbi:MAG: hypothetical protein ABFD16_02480, partial [Thermoguttaceae bacterium]